MVLNHTYNGDKKRNRAVAFPVAKDKETEELTMSPRSQEEETSTEEMKRNEAPFSEKLKTHQRFRR